jgi:uncharacterized Zn finger protein
MDRVCREGDGLFPSPDEIELSCSCPDWADMCKHVAAALYGVGARLDENPALLFVLRGVDESELIASAGEDLSLTRATPAAAQVLDAGDVAALFGLEMAETPNADTPAVPKPPKGAKTLKGRKATAQIKTAATDKKSDSPRNAEAEPATKRATVPGAMKRRELRQLRRSAS